MKATYGDVRTEVRRARKTAGRAVARRRRTIARSLSQARDETADILQEVRDVVEAAHDRILSRPHASLVVAFALGVVASGLIGRRR